jgi:hypothetical protein
VRAGRLTLRLDPERAFDAACALEDRRDRTAAETELLAALRAALRPALRMGLRTVLALDTAGEE